MPNDTEAMALALIRLLQEATDGEAMQWRTFRLIEGTEGAIVFALQRGWLLIDGNRAALTDLGCSVAEELGRPLHQLILGGQRPGPPSRMLQHSISPAVFPLLQNEAGKAGGREPYCFASSTASPIDKSNLRSWLAMSRETCFRALSTLSSLGLSEAFGLRSINHSPD
jgi:hypothetical protein